jgi:hypothetical protein
MASIGARLSLALMLLLLAAAETALLMWPGVLRINGHEADLVHTVDVAARMAAGELPHLDFMTPLGVLAFAPLAWLMQAGIGPGQGFVLCTAAVTLAMLPVLWRVADSRLSGPPALLFGAVSIVMMTAMVYGGDQATSSISMFYNRWGWVMAFAVSLLLVLPPHPGRASPTLDGAIIGSLLAVLFALKITYVVALLPAALVFALVARARRELLSGLVAGIAVLAAVSLAIGSVTIWPAYIGDVLELTRSTFRPQPGATLPNLLAAPGYLTATLLLIGTVVLWRKTGQDRAGLLLALLGPGFVYVTFQNWGNDPVWLFVLGLLLLSVRPADGATLAGQPALPVARGMALACFVVIAPSLLNMAYSPLRHAALDPATYTALFRGDGHRDIEVPVRRSFQGVGKVFLDTIPGVPEGKTFSQDVRNAVAVNGEDLGQCQMEGGLTGLYHHMADSLAARADVRGRAVLIADLNDFLWLMGPFRRSGGDGEGMAPWYYGGAEGFDGAEFVLVPLCPVSPQSRRAKMDIIKGLGWVLEPVQRDPHFILYRRRIP